MLDSDELVQFIYNNQLVYSNPGMSILSNSNYDNILQSISKIKQALQEQSNQDIQAYQMLGIKTKIIGEQINQTEAYMMRYEKECFKKIEKFGAQMKQKVTGIKQGQNNRDVQNQFEKELKQIISMKNKLQAVQIQYTQSAAQRLQRQIDILQQNFKHAVIRRKQALLKTQNDLQKQLEDIQNKLQQVRGNNSSQLLLEEILLIKESIDKQISQLCSRRKEKKENFLKLLENIIAKCKQSEQVS